MHAMASGLCAMESGADTLLEAVGELLSFLPASTPTSRRRGTDGRPANRCPRAARDRADPRHRLLRRPRRRPGGGRRRGDLSSCGRAGRPSSSPRSHGSAGTRSASSPTSRGRWPEPSTSRRRRRARASSASATLQPADLHLRRHAGVSAGQGSRVARDDPPRRRAGLRLRRGDGAADLRHLAQGVRRRLHRHGLQGPRQRHLSRLAGRRRWPSWGRQARSRSCTAGRAKRSGGSGRPSTGALPHALGGGRARLRRRGDRPRRHPAVRWPAPSPRSPRGASSWSAASTTRGPCKRQRCSPNSARRPLLRSPGGLLRAGTKLPHELGNV